MANTTTGCTDIIAQEVMDFIIETSVQGLRVGKVWRPVSLIFL